MANYVMGTMSIKGKSSEIVRFLNERVKEVATGIFHIEGTDRGFINQGNLNEEISALPDDEVCELSLAVEFAWYIHANEITELSKKYPLEFEIVGREPMVNFEQTVIVKDGELLKDEEIDLDV